MKISTRWLQELIGKPLGPAETIARHLEERGVEVSSWTPVGKNAKGIVLAKILEVKAHPNADRLSVCRVSDGKDNLTIVCGAKNIAPGQTVPLALPGAVLPTGQIIERTVIRGTESSGMLCSARELGISDDHSGILILEDGGKLGKPVQDVLPLNDVILEIEVTLNRPDCLSHIGIARELSSLLGKPLKELELKPEKIRGEKFPIDIENSSDCSRYIGTVIKNLTIGPSPFWLTRRLSMCGTRPINNIVDITNYVLLEWGHPLHAFDLHRLSGSRIKVRRARIGEKIAALDEKTYSLTPETLVIADESQPVAIAGIIGGASSAIQSATRDILLESACFDRRLVRRASKSLGIRTESSYRFERGSHPVTAEIASKRARELIESLAGGSPSTQTDAYPKKQKIPTIPLRPQRVNLILHTNIKPQEMAKSLKGLGFTCRPARRRLLCQTPFWRLDVEGEHDLIEEIARVKGYGNIPDHLPSLPTPRLLQEWRKVSPASLSRQILLAHGFSEGCSPSFVSENMIKNMDAGLLETAVAIENPLSEEQEYLRPNLSLHLIDAVRKNRHLGTNSLKLFEVGCSFAIEEGMPRETKRLAFVIYADPHLKHWRQKPAPVDFFEVKSWCEFLLTAWKSTGRFNPASCPYLHPGTSAQLSINGDAVGWAGLLHPAVAKAMDVPPEVGLAEFDLSKVKDPPDTTHFKELPKYPPVKRDISIIVNASVTWADIEKSSRESVGAVLENIQPFDVFSGSHLASDEKSLAFYISLRHPDKTLTDSEADDLIKKMLQALQDRLGAHLRTV